MGQLIMMAKKSGAVAANGKYYSNRNYKNKYAVENLIRYVTRTRLNEDRASDLLGYGVLGVSQAANVDQIISWFLYIQKIYNIDSRGGKRMYHEVFNLKNEEISADNWSLNPQNLLDVAWECSRVFYEAGHQVVFALHWEPDKHYHIHLAVNSVNFRTGRKFHTSMQDVKQREEYYNDILFRHQVKASGAICPIVLFNELNDQQMEECI